MAEAATPSQRPLSHSGLRIRLEPTLAQRRSMSRCAGASRFAFNWAISHVAANAAMWRTERDCGVESSQRTKPFTLVDLTKLWSLERSSVAPWWGDHPSKVYLFAFRDAVAASRNFLGSRARFPRFKAKHRTPRAFTLCDCIHLRPGELQITRIGKVKISAPDEHQAALRRLIRRGRRPDHLRAGDLLRRALVGLPCHRTPDCASSVAGTRRDRSRGGPGSAHPRRGLRLGCGAGLGRGGRAPRPHRTRTHAPFWARCEPS